MANIKSLIQLADEGVFSRSGSNSVLVKQQLFSTIKDAAVKNAVGRQLVDVIPLTEGSALDFDLATKDSMKVRKAGESAEKALTKEAYTKVTVTPELYAGNMRITRSMIEDSNFPLIERNLRQAGREMSYKETDLVLSAFNDTTFGFPAQSGHSFNSAGTELGTVDLVDGMELIEIQDYEPNTGVLHPTQVSELRNLDTFVEADKIGDRRMFETGWVGKIFGMDFVRSTLQSQNVVHLLDKQEAGVLVVRRPLTVERWNDPLRDLVNATFSQRMAARVLRPGAGVKITVQ